MYYNYASSNTDTFQGYSEIAVCNKEIANYNIMKNSGFWISQLASAIPNFFRTAAFNGEHTAVSPNCGVTNRG